MHALSDTHRRYIRSETLIGCVFNAALSVVFAFLIFRGATLIPLWGAEGIAMDLVPTVFMITLIGNLIVTLLTRRRVRDGAVPPLHDSEAQGTLARRLPRNALLRVLLAAVTMTVTLVPVSIGVLALVGVEAMPFWPFVAFKIFYGAAVGALSAPTIIRAALADVLTMRRAATA